MIEGTTSRMSCVVRAAATILRIGSMVSRTAEKSGRSVEGQSARTAYSLWWLLVNFPMTKCRSEITSVDTYSPPLLHLEITLPSSRAKLGAAHHHQYEQEGGTIVKKSWKISTIPRRSSG